MSAAERRSPSRARKWRRRLLRIALWGAALLLVLRVGLWLGMPWILDRVVAGHGLTCSYDSLHLSLLSGHVEIWQLELRPRTENGGDSPAPDPVAHLEYAEVDVDVGALLTGNLVVRRAEVDGLDARLVREADGGVWLADVPRPAAGPEPEEAEHENGTEPGRALDFTPPIVVHAARAQAVTLHIRDRPEDREHVVHVDVELSHLGSQQREAELTIDVWSPGTIEALRIRGRGRGGLASLAAEASLRGVGLRPGSIQPLLESLDLAPAADLVDFGLDLAARLEPEPGEDPAGRLTVDVENVYWHADAEESFGLDELSLQIPALDRLAAEDVMVAVRGLRGAVARSSSGRTRWGGFELLPTPDAEQAPEPSGAATSGPVDEPFRLHVRECRIEEAAFTLHDRAVDPPSAMTLQVPTLSAKALSTTPTTEPATLSARARIPDSVEELSITARLDNGGERRDLELGVRGEGVTLVSLRPWLQAAGFEPALENGELAFDVTAGLQPVDEGLTADLELKNLWLRDGEELLRLDSVAVRQASIGPDRIAIAEVVGQGPQLSLVLEEGGSLVFAGLRTVARKTARTGHTGAVEASTPDERREQTTGLLIERLSWGGLTLDLTDEQWKPTLRSRIDNVELTVTGIAVGIEEENEPAEIEASLAVADVARRVTLTGSAQTVPDGGLDADLELRGEGLRLAPLRPYLENAGIRPLLADGTLRVAVSAAIRQRADGTHARLIAREARLEDGDRQWLSLDELEVADAHLDARGTDVDKIVLRGMRVEAERDAEGDLRVLGILVSAGGPEADPAPADAEDPEPAVDEVELPPPPPLRLSEISFEDLEIAWSDLAQTEPLQVVARLQVGVNGLDTRTEDEPASWTARLEVPGEVENLELEGSLRLTESGPFLTSRLVAGGVHPDALAAYLPAGMEPALESGRLRVSLEASQTVEPNGVRSRFALTDFDLRDGDAEQPLVAATSMIAALRESEDEIVLEELTTDGITVEVRESGTGLEALGLRFTEASQVPDELEPGPQGRLSAAERLRLASPELANRVIRIDKLDLGVERLIWKGGEDGLRTTASLRITTPGPQVLLAEDIENLEPVTIDLTGRVEGILEELRTQWNVRPFTADPELELSFAATGLNGPGLMDAMPSLAERFDAGELENGSLRGDLRTILRMPRRSPTELDFSRSFGVRVELEDLDFRATTDGPVLAGVDAISTEVPRFQPGSGALHIAFLEIYGPRLVATQKVDGMHALGVLWKSPPPAEPPAEPQTEPEAIAAQTEETAGEPAPRAPRLRVDLVSLQDLTLDFVDESVEPPVPLPILNGDIELRGIDTDARRSKPVRFRASVNGGMVPLPERDYSSFFGGLLSAAAGVVTGGSDEAEIQQRPFFDELAASGSLRLDPLRGWVKVGLRSLELLNLRGLARTAGIEIGDGLFEAAVRMDFREDGDLAVESDLVFQYLSLSEPPGGPISTYLRLPAPLDTVLFVLRDSSGLLDVPLSFTVQQGGLSGITSAAVGAFGQLVATAIAKSPLRVAGTFTDLFGLTGGQPEQVEYEPFAVAFVPGSAALGPQGRQALEPLVELLLDDEELSVAVTHLLGTADVERAETFANPGQAETRELGLRLRQRKAELVLQRERTLTQARSFWASGDSVAAAEASERLTAVDRELGRLEQALDRVYGLLRPGAERRRQARTRDAALAVGRLRMQSVRDFLAQRGVPAVDERFESRRPRFVVEEERQRGEVLLQPRVRLIR